MYIKRQIIKKLHPRIINFILSPVFELRNIREDVKAYFNFYAYKHPVIFIIGLPKSGTTWVENFFSRIPGYVIRKLSGDPEYITKHGIPEDGFKYFSKGRYSCIKTHANPTVENFHVLKKNDINKKILIYRDPRDVAISRYFHLLKNPKTPDEPYYIDYRNVSKDEGIAHSIHVVKSEFFHWIDGWIKFSEQYPEEFCVIKYEDMYADPFKIFKKMVNFYEIDMKEDEITNYLDSLELMKNNFNVKTATGTKSTFRKGGAGDWKNHFTNEHIQLFTLKERKMLLQFGYEDFEI